MSVLLSHRLLGIGAGECRSRARGGGWPRSGGLLEGAGQSVVQVVLRAGRCVRCWCDGVLVCKGGSNRGRGRETEACSPKAVRETHV